MPALAQDTVLRVAVQASDIVTLDPHRATTVNDKGPVGWLFNGLVRFPPGSADPEKLEPDLAESWTSSPDGKEWVFKLRPGVKFHGDWGDVTADDVVYSLQRAKDPERSSFAAGYEAFKTIEAVDPLTVRIVLDHPVPGFLGLVANYHGGNIVSKKAAEAEGADFGEKPVGTGPFEFVQHTTQQNVTFEKNPDYFRGAPKIDRIDYRMIPQDSSRELAFSSGELDLIAGKREQRWVERWRQQPGAIVNVFGPGEYRMLHLNMTIPPLDDHRVREAIARAVNVDDIVAFVGADVGPKGCSVVPTNYLGADCTGWDYPYDIEKAKALLAEAGHPNGVTVKAVVSSLNAQLPIMEVIQAQLAEAGITLDMQVVDHPTYHDMIRKDVSGVTFYGSARYPIADTFLTEFFDSAAIVGKPTAITNFSHCAVADAPIEAARAELDPTKQLADWSEAQRLIHQEICAIPLFTLQQVWLQSDKLDLGYKLEGALNLVPPITEASVLKAE
ncbi:polyamine ABC transporter substrate-binding protein [Paracoccus pantotrophus]|nr:polyamine ABC transporter substrate-binding protein [Paracoccus pantotrophus]WGR67668.1 polyamine ABC transporter substrate-binding protein [Paracoccus pantotrophus]